MPGVDLNYFIRQANKLTEKVEKRKQELAEETIEKKSQDDLIAVTVSCGLELKALKIAPKAIDLNDVAMLEDLIVATVNAALADGKAHVQTELSKVSGGIKIPGIT